MPTNGKLTRRSLLQAGSALAAAPIVGLAAPSVLAQTPAKAPTKVLDFLTRANVAKAEQEGQLVFTAMRTRPAPPPSWKVLPRTFPRSRRLTSARRPRALQQDSLGTLRRPASTSTSSSSPTSRGLGFPEARRLRNLHGPRDRRLQAGISQRTGRLVLLDRGHFRGHRLQQRQGETGGGAQDLEGPAPPALEERDELQDFILRRSIRTVGMRSSSSMGRTTGRNSPSRTRAPSTRGSSCSTASPRATTRCARRPNTPPTRSTKRKRRTSRSSRRTTGCRRRR